MLSLCGFVMSVGAYGAIHIKTNNMTTGGNEYVSTMNGYDDNEAEEIAILQEDIRILDEELEKCKKKKKGWTAATIVGGVGVLGTGIAAIVQGNKIKDKKGDLSEMQKELKDKNQELNSLNGGTTTK